MKKLISVLLVISVLMCCFAGCDTNKQEQTDEQNTLTLLIPNEKLPDFIKEIQKKFPEINFEIEHYVGDNGSAYLSERIIHGEASDLIYYSVFTSLEEHTSQFLDLSDTTIPGTLKSDILSLLDVNGAIYQIPGPLETRCIAYNKTMFEEYGWAVPNNFDELVELCKQIRKEAPGVTPIVSSGQEAYYFSIPASIAQAGFMSTSEGYQWEQAFFKGEASVEEGFKEGLEGTKRLIDAGAFDGEKCAGLWNCDNFMANREAAMNIQWSGINTLYIAKDTDKTTDEFGFIPFYGLEETDKVIIFNSTGNWSINRKLGEKGNEKKLENALKVMEWITSVEAQSLLRTNETQLSVTKDDFEMDPGLSELLELTQNGFKDPMMYTGYEHMLVEAGKIITDAVMSGNTENMAEDFIEIGDKINKEYAENREASIYNSHVMENLTKEETAQLMANILLDTGMGDISLISQTGIKNGVTNESGVAGSIYSGGIVMHDILIVNADRAMHVATVDITGAQLRTLIEQGKGLAAGESHYLVGEGEEVENPESLPQEYFNYFWAGIDVTMSDGKVSSMKFKGKEMSDTETYTVVFSETDYPREFFGNAKVSELLVQDAMIKYFEKTPEIYAPEVLRK